MNRADLIRTMAAARRVADVAKDMLTRDAAADYEEQGTAPTWNSKEFRVTSAVKQGGPVVMDDKALLAYVEKNYPTEVQTVKQINPVFLKVLLDNAAKLGDPVDKDGTVLPGVEWREGGEFSHISVTLKEPLKAELNELETAVRSGGWRMALPAGEAA